MAWELIISLWVIVLLIVVTVLTISAGLEKVRHLDSLSRTVKVQRKKISQLGTEIMSLRSRLMESRRENTALRATLEENQRQLTILDNKLKAANLIIEQNNEHIKRSKS